MGVMGLLLKSRTHSAVGPSQPPSPARLLGHALRLLVGPRRATLAQDMTEHSSIVATVTSQVSCRAALLIAQGPAVSRQRPAGHHPEGLEPPQRKTT